MTNFLYCSVLFFFLMPKINIISVGNYNAGIRIDDFIIAIWLFIFLFGYVSNKRIQLESLTQNTINLLYLYL